MTREEAKEVLDDMKVKIDIPKSAVTQHKRNEALDMAISALSAEPCREVDDYENEIADLHNRLDIAEYDKERYKEEITTLETEIKGDLISRQAVENITWEEPSYTDPLNVLTEVREKVRALPSVENKGEWIKVQSGDKDFPESIVCSKCRNENSHFDFNEHAEPIGKVFVTSKFCPNCGADMRGKSENDEKDFPQTEDIEPTVKNFSKVLDNKLIRDTIQDCEQI